MAAELGPSRFPWWQDWRGECAAIIASGPSTKKSDVELLRERIHVIAIKENVNLCPWADVVYGCDGHWWRHRNGLPEFSGVKLCWDAATCAKFKLHQLKIKEVRKKQYVDDLLTDEPGVVGSGGNSGFQALNLAVQFGATGVLLLGFDADDRGGAHHYGRSTWRGANNPGKSNFRTWHKAFVNAAPKLTALGVDVVNTSEGSAINCFPKMSVEDAFKRWGL